MALKCNEGRLNLLISWRLRGIRKTRIVRKRKEPAIKKPHFYHVSREGQRHNKCLDESVVPCQYPPLPYPSSQKSKILSAGFLVPLNTALKLVMQTA